MIWYIEVYSLFITTLMLVVKKIDKFQNKIFVLKVYYSHKIKKINEIIILLGL
jgi:hypothetical protein